MLSETEVLPAAGIVPGAIVPVSAATKRHRVTYAHRTIYNINHRRKGRLLNYCGFFFAAGAAGAGRTLAQGSFAAWFGILLVAAR
jgi:hypothetical protein